MPTLPKVSRYLRDQDGTGSADLNVLGSPGSPIHFDLVAPANQATHISGVKFVIRAMAVRADKFGDIPGGLTEGEGLLLGLVDDAGAVALDFLDGEEVRTNTDISVLSGQGFSQSSAAGVGMVESNFRFQEPEQLPSGLRIRATVRADLRPLGFFRIMVRGRWLALPE